MSYALFLFFVFFCFFYALLIKIPKSFNTFVGILTVLDVSHRHFGPSSATEKRILEIHQSMGVMNAKFNRLLAGQEPDGGKAPPDSVC
ncbi:hypothetical protein FH972_008661 [Carpinus fangiana]|uniref:Uncharacterized protein n=1 Tax=Carpinus fangiana TaxID=176857 RepID=A0A5N6R112_9ROSI|nr:hypothetical protein FH972_008661 [Carpinus fangiana]